MTVGTLDDVETLLRLGPRRVEGKDEVKFAMMNAGVKIFIEAKVPEPEKPTKILEFSNNAKDFLLGLGIPGALEAMKGSVQ